MNAPLRTLKNPRSGYALILVITTMALLLTYLVAAQGSVMSSHRLMRTRAEKIKATEAKDIMLAEMQRRLEVELQGKSHRPGEKWFYGTGDEFLLLPPNDPIYNELPGFSHRDGDALLTLAPAAPSDNTTKSEPGKSQRYLLNGAKKRVGVIRAS